MMWQIVIGGCKGGFYTPSEGKLFSYNKPQSLVLPKKKKPQSLATTATPRPLFFIYLFFLFTKFKIMSSLSISFLFRLTYTFCKPNFSCDPGQVHWATTLNLIENEFLKNILKLSPKYSQVIG
jgi:hypothetical protein